MKRINKNLPSKPSFQLKTTDDLVSDIRTLIEKARERVAQTVDTGLVLLYWSIGHRIHKEILGEQRAAYGEQILPTLSSKLVPEYGEGFGVRNLARMIRFAEAFPDQRIVTTLSANLGWSHFVEILSLKDKLKRDFYAEMCRIERWSIRALRQKIGSMLFERTALSKKPTLLAKQELKALRDEDRMTPDLVFRDPYFLDFLGLKGSYSEKDLETAILYEMQNFLTEIGTDFSFIARQKRITVGGNDYYLDLLFYHRRLRCLTAIELKLDKFKPADMGQMELYLRWLEKYETRPGENPPLGLILCAQKHHEEVELLRLDRRGIRVAEYMTQLPSRKLLEKKLHDAIRLARERLEIQKRRLAHQGGSKGSRKGGRRS